MKTFLLALLSLITLSVLAVTKVEKKQFKIKKLKDNQNYMVKVDKELILMQVSVMPKAGQVLNILSRKEFPNIYFIIYNAGQSGTSFFVDNQRAAIWHPDKNQFIGDIPYKSVAVSSKKKMKDITWENIKGNLVVKEQGYTTQEIKLK